MKVIFHAQHNSFSLSNALDLIRPLPSDLDTSLDGLSTSVHRQHHIISKVLRDKLGEFRENIIVEGARAQRQRRGLLNEYLDEFGVAVALVHGGIGRQEIEILLALGIPNFRALGPGNHDGQRVVVVGGILALGLDGSV